MEPMRLLRSFFSEVTIRRGVAYAEDDKVRHIELEPYGPSKGAEQWLLKAVVDGERGNQYQSSLLLLLDKGHLVRLSANCSCPIGNYCKHTVAALLVWLWQEPLLIQGNKAGIKTIAPRRDDRLPRPEVLALVADSPTEEERYRLVLEPWQGNSYLMKHPGLLLKPMRQRRLKSGQWSKLQPVPLHSFEQSLTFASPWMDAGLVELLARLAFLPEIGQGQGLEMAAAPWLLPELLASGLLYWHNEDQALTLGPECVAQTIWQNEAKEQWRLRLTLANEQATLLPFFPYWYRDIAKQCLGPVVAQLHPSMAQWVLSRRMFLEVDVLFLCQSSLAELLPPCPVASAQPPTKVRLTFNEMEPTQKPVQSRQAFWAALLEFEYQGDWLPAQRPVPMQSRLAEVLHNRHLPTEEYWLNILAELGLTSWNQRLDLPQLAQDRHCRLVPLEMESNCANVEFWHDFVRHLPWLRQQGLAVDWPTELGVEPQYLTADDWLLQVDEQPQSEWFEVKLGVQLGQQKLDLLPALKSLLARPQELARLEHWPPEQDWPLYLPDGRVLAVPQSRLRLWLKPILGMPRKDEQLRLPRWQAADLMELEGSGRWLGSDSARRLAQRLSQFSGIDPVSAPLGLQTELRPYQLQGLAWLQFLREYELAGVLADDMGLGKTVQTLAHLVLEQEQGRLTLPSLVVAPTSLLPNWRSEAQRLAPSLKVVTLHGAKREQSWSLVAEAQLVLTSYPLLARDQEFLSQQAFHLLVFDEAQQLKTPTTQQYKAALTLQARHRLALTGTPLENHLGELWALFQQLVPGLLGNQTEFKRHFRQPIEQGNLERQQELAQRVRPFILRRHKREVVAELPDKTEIPVWLDLVEGQRDLYEAQRLALDHELRKQIEAAGLAQSQIHILAALLRLRQICCDPALAGSEVGAAKMDWLEQNLPEMLAEGRRVLIFSQFTQLLARVEQVLKRLKLDFVSLTGSTKDRELPVQRFQQRQVPIFLLSLKAGGTGLNLTAADTLIHLDPWWNPAVTEQATARAWRIGQDREVFVYKLFTLGTVEEKILAMQQRKQALSDDLLAGSLEQVKLDSEDLTSLFSPF